jgi:alpha-mannosidase
VDGGYPQQVYPVLDGDENLMVSGVRIPAFSTVTLPMKPGMPEGGSVFAAGKDTLETPFARVRFAENGTISSFTDLRVGRELVAGRPFNTLVMAEDLPSAWDNWDLDADIIEKFRPVSNLVSRETVSAGPVAYIVRTAWRISERSTLTQDIIFFASSPEVRFDTRMNWKDDHRFLKACFDTDVYDDFARHEIQFGCVKRPTTRNNSIEEAKFEVVNHKYTDLSEPAFGVTLLNDCKYGITVNGGSLQISLHKGGVHPDYKGDKDGVHTCVYSFLPHVGGFSAENAAHPAYMLNVPVLAAKGMPALAAPARVEAPNVIVESVKPCEDGGRAYILRLYEAEGSYTETALRLPAEAKAASLTNMLEEPLQPLDVSCAPRLVFRPFEIKTVKVEY